MGFWSSVWSAVTGRGRSSGPPAANEPTYGGTITPSGSETPGYEKQPRPISGPAPDAINPEQESVWGGAGANQQEIDTLAQLRDRFEAWPSFYNWRQYAAAQEDMGMTPDWQEFRENYDPSFV